MASRKPLAGPADHPVGRDPHVVEVHLAGGRALDAELALGAPKLTPGSDFSTTKPVMPRVPAPGSVTAKTV
jgi:hypothetical protein